VAAKLIVHAEGQRAELLPGATMPVAGGALTFERLTGWIGYRIYYDPTLPWLFALAVIAVAGLAWHIARSELAEHGDGVAQASPERSWA
jgi:cytochrome c biogenesis protein